MARPKRVMVVHPVGDPQQMPTLRGISDYARQRGDWIVQFSPEMHSPGLRQLARWPGQGVIAALRTRAEVAAARAIGVPVINLSGALKDAGLPRVMVDQEAMGHLAADHLLACGLKRFAYYGERNMWYSQQRKRGFMARLAQAGLTFSLLETTTSFGRRNPWYTWVEPIEQWLRQLQPPLGLFAVHDYAAAVILHACSRIGLRVPADVAVVGTGDDRATCEFCEVPLTSVARSNREVGYRAAALLDRLMAGRRPPRQDLLIAPEGIVQRRSTDTVATDDPRVSAAVHYIQEHMTEPFSVQGLGEMLGISQRALELSFRKSLGVAPRTYLARARVKEAQRLIAAGDGLKLVKVGRLSGFGSLRQFYDTFRRVTGQSPAEYRRRCRDESWGG